MYGWRLKNVLNLAATLNKAPLSLLAQIIIVASPVFREKDLPQK